MEPVILTILAVVFLKAFLVPSVASIFKLFYLKYGLKGVYTFKKYETYVAVRMRVCKFYKFHIFNTQLSEIH